MRETYKAKALCQRKVKWSGVFGTTVGTPDTVGFSSVPTHSFWLGLTRLPLLSSPELNDQDSLLSPSNHHVLRNFIIPQSCNFGFPYSHDFHSPMIFLHLTMTLNSMIAIIYPHPGTMRKNTGNIYTNTGRICKAKYLKIHILFSQIRCLSKGRKKNLYYWLSIPYLKCLGTEHIWIPKLFFLILEYLHKYNGISWGYYELIYVSYTS